MSTPSERPLPTSPDANPLVGLRDHTSARIGLARTGVSVTTADLLAFQADHALARDAVHAPFDAEAVAGALAHARIDSVLARSQAKDRSDYLKHPGNGRVLAETSLAELDSLRNDPSWDVVIVVSDGLSATAANEHAADITVPFVAHLLQHGLSVAPVVIVPLARVGIMDDIGAAVAARSAAIVIGERPGLSAPDNLSIYLEVSPRPGRTDADRNCLSNISPHGLLPDVAAEQAASLLAEGLRRGISGTALKAEFTDGTPHRLPAP